MAMASQQCVKGKDHTVKQEAREIPSQAHSFIYLFIYFSLFYNDLFL
jgi:hypothetical protein